MAENYLLFSEQIVSITEEEEAWIRQVLDVEDEKSAVLKEAGLRVKAVDVDCWPGFEWDVRDAELWIYSEESGYIEHVGEFVRAFLSRFRRDDCWSLTWAAACSKPRIGEFYGGGLFVTAKNAKFFNAADALNQMHRRFEKSRRRS